MARYVVQTPLKSGPGNPVQAGETVELDEHEAGTLLAVGAIARPPQAEGSHRARSRPQPDKPEEGTAES